MQQTTWVHPSSVLYNGSLASIPRAHRHHAEPLLRIHNATQPVPKKFLGIVGQDPSNCKFNGLVHVDLVRHFFIHLRYILLGRKYHKRLTTL
jgi:hypothetical protein